jgi:hypothetical protein
MRQPKISFGQIGDLFRHLPAILGVVNALIDLADDGEATAEEWNRVYAALATLHDSIRAEKAR